MATLSIRKLDDDVYSRLNSLALKHGISTEEEACRILKQAVMPQTKLGDMAVQFFGQEYGVELDLPCHEAHEPVDLPQ